MQAKVSNTKLEKHEQIGGWVGFMTAYAGYIGQIYLYRHAIESYGWKAFIPLIATNTASSFYEKARKKKIGTRSKNLDSIIE
ncbi:hypothetical protein KY348_00825 [Candidatus Woesearchaeota archaeon]|nr:hypothetical protein [Candidatus Woesearchaeota archaeon]